MNGSQNNISLYRSLTRGPDNHYRYRIWSTIIGRGPLLCSHWSRPSLVMLAPAVLCHKEPARRIQSLQGGILLAPRWGSDYLCLQARFQRVSA